MRGGKREREIARGERQRGGREKESGWERERGTGR